MSTNRFLTILNNARQLVTAISTSAGAGDGNKIVATDSSGRLSSTLMPVGVALATKSIVASEALSAGDFVNIWSNSGTENVRKADASNSREAHGFVLAAVASGASATVYLQGENTALSGLTPGTVRFLSATPGASSATAPAATAIFQELGVATSPTTLIFEYDRAISQQ